MASLAQAAKLIATAGQKVTVMLKSEPGCGKSSTLLNLARLNGDKWRRAGDQHPEDAYQYIYADCPLMDLPDFAMPVVENKTTFFAPSSLWGFNDARPKVIMLDEVSKAPNVVKPMFTRLMLERCIGEFKLPEGSIVFATGNNASDGVGDTMQGHINNRITAVNINKPSSEEWIDWGVNNGVNEILLTAVHQFPHVMQSYLDDGAKDNPYIFNPKRNTGAFASPRSLEKASYILDGRDAFGYELTQEALEGTVGVSFARDLMAYLSVAKEVPTWEEILQNPKKTKVPDSPAAQLLLVFGSIPKVNKDNAAAWVEYFFRFDTEVRMLWARQFKNSKAFVDLVNVKEFRKVLSEDCWVFQ